MILSNIELHRALDEKRIIISPEPKPRLPTVESPHCPYDTHSVDLQLASEIVVPDSDIPATYDLSRAGSIASTIANNSKKFELTNEQPFKLRNGQFILAKTLEKVTLPIKEDGGLCLAARIEGKSSRARIGLLVHFTAPTVHPGFSGTLTLEMINLGPLDILLTPGMPIAQLIVEEVKGVPQKNPSQFQNQQTAVGL